MMVLRLMTYLPASHAGVAAPPANVYRDQPRVARCGPKPASRCAAEKGIKNRPVSTGHGFQSPRGAESCFASGTMLRVPGGAPPAEVSSAADRRRLGMSISANEIGVRRGDQQPIALDDPRLDGAFHPAEAHLGLAWRWSEGRAVLAASLWQTCARDVVLTLTTNARASSRWIPFAGESAGADAGDIATGREVRL